MVAVALIGLSIRGFVGQAFADDPPQKAAPKVDRKKAEKAVPGVVPAHVQAEAAEAEAQLHALMQAEAAEAEARLQWLRQTEEAADMARLLARCQERQGILVRQDARLTEPQIEQMIFQQDRNVAGARKRLVTVLARQIEVVDCVCKLTECREIN